MNKILKTNTFLSKKFVVLVLTAALATVLVYFNQIIDNVITANILGTNALSATNICAPLMTASGFIAILFGSGTTESVGNWLWVGERDKANRLFSYGIIISLVAGGIFFFVTAVFKEPILHLFGVTDNIYSFASDYYSFIILAGLIQPLFSFLTGIVFISGDSKISGIASVSQLSVNVIVSLILCPVLGTRGAAIGTICGFAVGLVVLAFHFIKSTNKMKFTFRIKAKYLKKSFNYTLIWTMPAVYNIIIMIWINNYIVEQFGDQFLPLSAVVSAMLGLISFFEIVSTADNPLIGTYSAENNVERCQTIMRSAAIMAAIIAGIILFVSLLFPQNMLNWFGIADVDYLRIPGELIIRLMSVGLAVMAVGTVFVDYYFYLQFHGVSVIFQSLTQFVFPLVFSLVLGSFYGLFGMLIGYIIACALPYALWIPVIRIKYGKEMFPYMMKPMENEIIRNFDTVITQDGIIKMRKEAETFLIQNNVPKKIIMKVLLMIEETGFLIMEKNPNKKVLLEAMINISNGEISMIMRDDGVIFDITDADMNITSFRVFVLSRMMDNHNDKKYFYALNYNRNGYKFVWKQNSEEVEK